MSALDTVIQQLGLSRQNDSLLFISDENITTWRDKIPYRLQKGLEEIRPDAVLVQEDKPLVLFFDFETTDRDREEVSRDIWNLGGVPIVFFIEKNDVTVYNGYAFDTNTSVFERLNIDASSLNYLEILSGKLWRKLQRQIVSKVDESLLANIQAAQEVLINTGLPATTANNLIGRLLFSRYLLDREVHVGETFFTDKESFLSLIQDRNRLYDFFTYLKNTFNGDLFPWSEGERELINQNHLEVLYRLFKGDEISTGQVSLFDRYNFKIIPIELISEVYERFIGRDSQRKEGAYYTPAFLVDYILEKTVKRRLSNTPTCRVLDPSCGSGIFLVESLRCIIEKNKTVNAQLSKQTLISAVTNNIFGIDKDDNAVNLTIFSLYLTLLDYQEPKDITKFKFPSLKNKNIFSADFFDMENSFNSILGNVDIDYILGNPPWKSDGLNDGHIDYYTSRNIPVSDKQLAQSFMARVQDFSSANTRCALVLTSKILYNHYAKDFRAYLLNHFYVDEVLELSPVRKHLFKNATAPSAVVFYRFAHTSETSTNTLTHTSVKPNIFLKYLGLIVIEKIDRKEVQQKFFLEYDWLWKTLLYGNVFDFLFIKRLKVSYPDTNTLIAEKGLGSGVGLKRRDGNKKVSMSSMKGVPFIDLPKRDLRNFYVHSQHTWDEDYVGNLPRKGVFEPPYVLLKRGFEPSTFRMVAAYSEKKYVFTDSVTSIFGNDKETLKCLAGMFNSDLHSYLLLMLGSYAGVEREKALDEPERFTFPVAISNSLANKVELIQNMHEIEAKNDFFSAELHNNILKEEKELNELIIRHLCITDFEQKLTDYALNVSVPLFTGKEDPYQRSDKALLESYVEVFMKYFDRQWGDKKLQINIYTDDLVVGINFKIVDSKSVTNIQHIKGSVGLGLAKALSISAEQITDKVFLQRYVRGIQKDSFYIVKPNEAKNWHQAIAQVDLNELINEMLKASQ